MTADLDTIMRSDSSSDLQHFVTRNPTLISFRDPFGRSFLMGAIVEGKEKIALEMISHTQDFTAKSNSGRSLLHYAALLDSPAIIERLLEIPSLRACINDKDNTGHTALHIAAIKNHPIVIARLLQNGALADIKDTNQKTAFEYAAEHDSVELLQAFSEPCIKTCLARPSAAFLHLVASSQHIAPFIFQRTPDICQNSSTLLHTAVESKNISAVRALIEQRVSLDALDSDEESPLSLACLCGHDEIATLLLQNNANPNLGKTAPIWQVYLRDGVTDLLKLLIEKKANPFTQVSGMSLHQFIEKIRDTECKEFLVQHIQRQHANTTIVSATTSRTSAFDSIIAAAKNATVSQFEAVLECSTVDILQTDPDKNNALQVALIHHNNIVAALIIAHFGKLFIDHKNSHGKTAVHTAVEKANVTLLKRMMPFLQSAPNKDTRGNSLFHALVHATGCTKQAACTIIDLLLSLKVDINALNNEQKSALHYAAECGNQAVFHALLEKGANPNSSKDPDNSLLSGLLRKHQYDDARALIQSGVKRNAKCGTSTQLITACEHANKEVVFDLLDQTITCSKPADLNFTRSTKSALIAATRRFVEDTLHRKSVEESEVIFLHLLRSGVKLDKCVRESKNRKISALTLACYSGITKIVELLLRFGANATKRPKGEHSPLSIAYKRGYPEIAALLLEHGAKATSEVKKRFKEQIKPVKKEGSSLIKKITSVFSTKQEQVLSVRKKNLSMQCSLEREESPEGSIMSESCSDKSSLCSDTGYQAPFDEPDDENPGVSPDELQARLAALNI